MVVIEGQKQSNSRVRHFFALEANFKPGDGSGGPGGKSLVSFASAEGPERGLRPRDFHRSNGLFFRIPLTEKKIPNDGSGGEKGILPREKIHPHDWHAGGTLCRGDFICACLRARLRFCGAKLGFENRSRKNFCLPVPKRLAPKNPRLHQRRRRVRDEFE